MKQTETTEIKERPISLINSLARSLVLSKLNRFKYGFIQLEDGKQSYNFGCATDTLQCRIRVIDPSFYRFMAIGGSLGAAEAFMDGLWEVDN